MMNNLACLFCFKLLIARINIKIPTNTSGEEKLLYQKLKEISDGKNSNKSVKEKLKGVFK